VRAALLEQHVAHLEPRVPARIAAEVEERAEAEARRPARELLRVARGLAAAAVAEAPDHERNDPRLGGTQVEPEVGREAEQACLRLGKRVGLGASVESAGLDAGPGGKADAEG